MIYGGLAEYFDVDPTIIRLLFFVLSGADWVVYLILWFIMKPTGSDDSKDDIVQG